MIKESGKESNVGTGKAEKGRRKPGMVLMGGINSNVRRLQTGKLSDGSQ